MPFASIFRSRSVTSPRENVIRGNVFPSYALSFGWTTADAMEPIIPSPVQDVDYDHVAKKSEGFSGADLKAVVDRAIEAKLKEAMKAGVPTPLTTKDLVAAASGVKPSTREWFSTARNYALYSNQGGVYDDILKYLKM